MRRGIWLVGLGLGLMVAGSGVSEAQFTEFTIDPRLGPLPTFGPGGYISNGNGYSGPNGAYWPGIYMPGNDLGNGPSPYYSPLYSALNAAPRPRMTYEQWLFRVPGHPQSRLPEDRAGWRLDPSLPDLHLLHRRRRR